MPSDSKRTNSNKEKTWCNS